ncbi:MAG: UV DNA damage repair endonuclease UvsE, partial [Nitrosopumilus sp.]|nr:UV DNA damage repair endonuclease UvsE [Nitrosopumilus sp.]
DQTVADAFREISVTWKNRDGIPMIDYSSQQGGCKIGKHVGKLNSEHFRKTMSELAGFDFDLMLEIKDKERSAIEALRLIEFK